MTLWYDDNMVAASLRFPGMEATIEVSGLCKRFGSVLAVDGLSFTVLPGQVTGFVGPNGAGKIDYHADNPGS